MSIIKHEESILVFTYKNTNTLLHFAGSQSWVLNEKRARKAKYLVCVRNCHNSLSEETVGHGAGFFVGKISGLRPAFTNQEHNRWMIEFDEYAEINVPGIWQGWRNPVVYMPTSEIGIDFEELNFKSVPIRDFDFIKNHLEYEDRFEGRLPSVEVVREPRDDHRGNGNGISIQDAKQMLSIRYDVEVNNIEIILKG